jgi:hypothetical protein
MFEFVIAIVAVLVVLAIVSNARKRSAEKANPATAPKAPTQENKPVVKPIVNAELEKEALPEPVIASKPAVEVIVTSPGVKTVALAHKDNSNDHLPQDSTLRRHYLAHLHAIIDALNPARPTDSTLSRHYDALIHAEIDQCLSEPAAIERLQHRFDDHKKTAAQKIQQAEVIAKPVVKAKISQGEPVASSASPVLPEDSTLRRHAIQLNSL